MKIAIGCDHGGIVLKDAILSYLTKKGIEYVDVGCYTTDSVDYPVFAKKVAKLVASNQVDKGILLCGTGIGISIAANKVNGIRAAQVDNEFCAEKCAEHNNVNVLCLGGRVVSSEKAVQLVDIWLTTPFAGGRHEKRIQMIMDIENEEN